MALFGWTGPRPAPCPPPETFLFCDADQTPSGDFQVGLFHQTLGVQVHKAPPYIKNQQEGEAYALEYALRVVSYSSHPSVAVVGDNLGTIFNGKSLCPRISSDILNYLARRIFNRIYWSRLQICFFWSPSALNPADPPSRYRQDLEPLPDMVHEGFTRFRALSASIQFPFPKGVLIF